MGRQEFERDELGNMILPDHGMDRATVRAWQYTYIFRYFDEQLNTFVPCFDMETYNDESLAAARQNPEFIGVNIHGMPLEMIYRDVMIYHRNVESALLAKYFTEVFEINTSDQGHGLAEKYYTLYMKKSHYYEIMQFIYDHNLFHFRDLILEIIANAQERFVEDVYYKNEKQLKHKINNLKKDAANLEKIIDKTTTDDSFPRKNRKEPKTPDYITIAFNDASYKLTDPFLLRSILENVKDGLANTPVKNWKDTLYRYSHFYDDDLEELKFPKLYTAALYRFFKEGKIIDVEAKPYPNDAMRFLDRIISFSLIPIGTEAETEAGRLKIIRRWLTLTTIKEKARQLELKPDFELLNKYFDPHFTEIPLSDNRPMDVLNIAGYLVMRFNLQERGIEIAHITQCLRDSLWLIFDQLSSGAMKQDSFPEFEHYEQFIKALRNHQLISQVRFEVDGIENPFEFNGAMPLHLVNNALNYYIRNFEEEAENDIVKGKITRVPGQAVYQTNRVKEMQLPEERFIVRFVASMYEFLLNEFPPADWDARPSSNYYLIIANLLLRTGYFRSQPKSEDQAAEQVQGWHLLSKPKPASN